MGSSGGEGRFIFGKRRLARLYGVCQPPLAQTRSSRDVGSLLVGGCGGGIPGPPMLTLRASPGTDEDERARGAVQTVPSSRASLRLRRTSWLRLLRGLGRRGVAPRAVSLACPPVALPPARDVPGRITGRASGHWDLAGWADGRGPSCRATAPWGGLDGPGVLFEGGGWGLESRPLPPRPAKFHSSHHPVESERDWESCASMRTSRLLRRLAAPLRSSVGLAGEEASAVASVTGRDFAAQAAPQDDLVTVTVDGKEVQVPKGASVLQACDAAGIDIPRRVNLISPCRLYSRAVSPPRREARMRL